MGLSSGGLDSILSALVLKRQGIDVEWVTFETPFFSSAKARQAAKSTGIPITVQDITTEYLKMLKNPPAGYGKQMNPCLDCHALMFRLAGEIMKEKGFDFLFSGEVVGQRPMSQTKPSLRYVEKASGFDGLIVRPLSAQRLPPTLPEKQGLVKRDLLLDFSGRSRKPQIQLAETYGISDYPSPAGGCLLTDKGYSDRLRDLFDHQETHTREDLYLLSHGRHIRLDDKTKMIVGRTRQDNENIEQYYRSDLDTLVKVSRFPGPTVLIPHGGGKESLIRAASICVGYSKAPNNREIDVTMMTPRGQEMVKVIGTPPKEIRHLLL